MGTRAPISRLRLTLVVTALALGIAPVDREAIAAPGDLDTTFAGDGKTTLDFSEGSDHGNAVTYRASTNSILVAGSSHVLGETDDFVLASINATSGALSLHRMNFGAGSEESAHAVAVQSDGLVVMAGQTNPAGDPPTVDFGAARYDTSTLLPDPTFAGDGSAALDIAANDVAFGVGVQVDGKIVAAGTSSAGGGEDDFALTRFEPEDGAPDLSFDTDGEQVTDFGAADQARAMVIQPADQKILAVGSSGTGTAHDFAVARYRPVDGSLDPAFKVPDGKLTTDFGGADHAYDVAMQPDGKFIVAGETGSGSGDFALARYLENGTLDTTFSPPDGKVVTDFAGNADGARGVALQADGRIVAVGRTFSPTEGNDFAIARYESNGALDTNFSGDGRQTIPFGKADIATGVVIQPDGQIVVAGSTESGPLDGDFAIARLDAAGGAPPPPDGDGDGVVDASDACPAVAASTASGCPAASPKPPPPPPPSPPGSSAADPAPSLPLPFPPPSAAVSKTKGTAGADRLTGGPLADLLCGEGGDDRIDGLGGDDRLFGDFCVGARIAVAARAAQAGQGDDVVSGGAGDDRLTGGGGADRLSGGAGRDRLSGGSGRDGLTGGAGNDTMTGGAGADRLSGGAGRDTLSAANGGKDVVDCGPGRDTARVDRSDRVRGCERVRRVR